MDTRWISSRWNVSHILHTGLPVNSQARGGGSSYSRKYICSRARGSRKGKGREENEKGSNWNCARMEHITVVSFMSFEFEKRSRIKHDNRPFRGPFGGQGKARLLCERLERLVGVNLFFFLYEWKVIWETPSRITGLFHSFNSSKYTRIILYILSIIMVPILIIWI